MLAPSLVGPSRRTVFTTLDRLVPTTKSRRTAQGLQHSLQSTRGYASGSRAAARQAIGRITPKRIAVPIPRGGASSAGSGGDGGLGGLPQPTIWRPIIFCLLLGGGGYCYAAAYTNHDTSVWTQKLNSAGGSWWRGQPVPSDEAIMRAKKLAAGKEAQTNLNVLSTRLASSLPPLLATPLIRLYITYHEYVLNQPPAVVVPMQCAAGLGVVFLAWKVRRWEPFMRKWFLHRPVVLAQGARAGWANSVTLFTSVISHQSFAHLFFNSFALTSFGSAAYYLLATPPSSGATGNGVLSSGTHTPHFLAFLLTAGLFSSLSSHLYTNLVRLPRLLRALASPARLSSPAALAGHHAILPSLGASGAIYGALTLTACAFPETNVGIIFIPMVSFPIWMGVGGMVVMDVVGLLRGWAMFDHVAHLGGAVFGILYYKYGRQVYDWVRVQLGAVPRGSVLV